MLRSIQWGVLSNMVRVAKETRIREALGSAEGKELPASRPQAPAHGGHAEGDSGDAGTRGRLEKRSVKLVTARFAVRSPAGGAIDASRTAFERSVSGFRTGSRFAADFWTPFKGLRFALLLCQRSPSLPISFPMVALVSTNATASDFARMVNPIGVAAAVRASEDSSFVPRPRIFEEFSLAGRVGVVSSFQA